MIKTLALTCVGIRAIPILVIMALSCELLHARGPMAVEILSSNNLGLQGWTAQAGVDGAEFQWTETGLAIRIEPWEEGRNQWPRVMISGPAVDLSNCSQLELQVANVGERTTDIAHYVVSGDLRTANSIPIPAGDTVTLRLNLADPVSLDSSAVDNIGFYLKKPSAEARLKVVSIRAVPHPDFTPARRILRQRLDDLEAEITALSLDEEDGNIKVIRRRMESAETLWKDAKPGYAALLADLLDETRSAAGILAFGGRDAVWMAWKDTLGKRLSPGTMPGSSVTPLEELGATVLRNEYEAICVNITNSGQDRTFEVSFEDDPQNPLVSLRPVYFSRARDGSHTGDAIGTPVRTLSLVIPANSTAQFLVWIDTKTEDVSPGTHRSKLHLREAKQSEVLEIPLLVEVLPERLSDSVPFLYQNWSYFFNSRARVTSGLETEALSNLRDYGVNTFVIPYQQIPLPRIGEDGSYLGLSDTERFEQVVSLIDPQPGERLIVWLGFDGSENRALGTTATPHGDSWNTILLGYVADLKHLLAERGIGPGQWILQFYDEASVEPTTDTLKAMQTIHAADPGIRFLHNGSVLPESPGELEILLALPVDWMPNWEQFFFSRPEEAEKLRAANTGNIGLYHCLMSRNNQGVNIHEYYRLMPWRVIESGFGSMGFWTYNAQHPGEDPWDGTLGAASGGIVVYEKDGELLTSRRWELLREGVEDYLLLQLVTKNDGLLDARRDRRAAFHAREMLDHTTDPTTADRVRQNMLSTLSATREADIR